MLSIIVCSRNPGMYDRLVRNIRRTIGVEFALVRINNETNRYGICAAYNKGMDEAKGDIFLFLHEDVLFITHDWGKLLFEAFKDSQVLGVGLAGSSILTAENTWYKAGQPNIYGHVIHPQNEVYDKEILFAQHLNDAQVVALDGVFIAVRATIARELQFDETNFPKFDHYDIDFSLRLAQHGKIVVVQKILIKHFSSRNFADDYENNPVFQDKHKTVLPYKLRPELQPGEREYYQRLIPVIHFPEDE